MTQLFLDCDGVLADFDKRAFELLGMTGQEFEDEHGSEEFWRIIREDDEFFYNLDPLPHAMKLWRSVEHLHPIILTGCPKGGWAEAEKRRWAKKHFGTEMIITCRSKNKRLYGRAGDVLVDDLLKYRHLWEGMGGVFVHFTDLDSTLRELTSLGLM